MLLYCNIINKKYFFDSSKPLDISIQQKFDQRQPGFFNTKPASKKVYKAYNFIGATELHGSCNVNVVNINIHCNGTHTESKQHIDHTAQCIGNIATDCFRYAKLITVTPVSYYETIKESYQPFLNYNDVIVLSEDIQDKLSDFDSEYLDAIVIRTLPNDISKKSKKYDMTNSSYAFLTNTAIELINSTNIKHILIDTPSLERSYNSSDMSNHKIFWRSSDDKTITEFIYVNNDITDGYYMLNLQVANFDLDTAPSRPILYKLENQND